MKEININDSMIDMFNQTRQGDSYITNGIHHFNLEEDLSGVSGQVPHFSLLREDFLNINVTILWIK